MAETPTAAQARETIERRVPEALRVEAEEAGECQCKQCEHVRLVQAGFRIEHLEAELQALREAVRRAEERMVEGDGLCGACCASILRQETFGLMGEPPCPPTA